MLNNIPKYIWQFVMLTLIQIVVLDNVAFNGYINPYLYILFIITLPFETNKLLVMGLAFLQGLIVDIFITETIGIHLSASIFLAFMRPFILRLVSPREGYEFGQYPTISDMGIVWFITYSGILTLLHHLFFFYVETFRFSEFFSTMFRAILSTTFTLILILIAQYLSYRPHKR